LSIVQTSTSRLATSEDVDGHQGIHYYRPANNHRCRQEGNNWATRWATSAHQGAGPPTPVEQQSGQHLSASLSARHNAASRRTTASGRRAGP
jgi:hypothetical protein